VKLYEVPHNTWITTDDGFRVFFGRIDGMYSYCLTEDNEVCHIKAWTEVTIDGNQESNRTSH
jgi:hypothetical protein